MTNMADLHTLNVDPVVLGEVDDDNLKKAIEESRRDRSTMPLIKQELRYTIQYRRLSSGQGELVVDEESPPEYKLTNEEVRKRYRRRQQNRQSSVRCRRKRKEYSKELEKAVTELEKKQCDLQQDIKRLNVERKHLEKLVQSHLKHGKCKSRMTRQTASSDLDSMQTKVETHNSKRRGTTQISNRPVSQHIIRKCRPNPSGGNHGSRVSLLRVH